MAAISTTQRLTQLSSGKVRYVREVRQIPQLSAREQSLLSKVTDEYAFRANTYYLDLIDWDDPEDPIRKIVVPGLEELEDGGGLDPSDEAAVTITRGVEHKYDTTVVLLVSEVCGTYCRFCFRKRLFMQDNDEVSLDISAGLEYVRRHPEVDNVLLTGGDALILGTRRLDQILGALRDIPHVRIIRIGTKMPAFNPYRILDDPGLCQSLARHSRGNRRIYVMAHFNHPRELTGPAVEGLGRLLSSGAIVVNQTPLLRGVNDDPDTIAELFNHLSYLGVPPYYLFQGRPIAGNASFRVPLRRGCRIFEQAKERMSGLAKRARYAMSHSTGKIEIVGFLDGKVVLKYHQAKDPGDMGRLFALPCPPQACWLDELPGSGASGSATPGRRPVGAN
ncbi:MAG: KamA family radical SAM protein [Gemmatimonadota bacterium]